MRVTKEAIAKCQAEIDRCEAIAKKHYPNATLPRPHMSYGLTGHTAGTYNPTTHVIRINGILLMQYTKEMVENTVSHEYAHLVDKAVNGVQYNGFTRTGARKRVVHGHTFKRIMRQFGRDESRTHKMDTSTASTRSRPTTMIHIWKCGCGVGKVVLTPNKHARMLKVARTGYGAYMRGHTPNRCGNYTYYGTTVNEIKPMQLFAAKAAAPKPVVKSDGESKLDKCRRVYDPELSRAANIVAFTEEGCTLAGAGTYYAKIKKEF